MIWKGSYILSILSMGHTATVVMTLQIISTSMQDLIVTMTCTQIKMPSITFSELYATWQAQWGAGTRSGSTLCGNKHFQVSIAHLLGIMGPHTGKGIPNRFWLSWVLLPTVWWVQETEGVLLLLGTKLPLWAEKWLEPENLFTSQYCGLFTVGMRCNFRLLLGNFIMVLAEASRCCIWC